MKILIKNGRILDPATKTDGIYDLLTENQKITKIEKNITEEADTVLDAEGCFVMPGLIDLHVHLREPGQEHKETIQTGAMAAARGGFTSICPMPNTTPSTDCPEMISWVLEKAREDSVINILPVGAVTIGQAGTDLADIKGMAEAGAVAISEDGKSVMDTATYLEGMREAAKNNLVVMAHCEDKNLVGKGVLNEGKKSKEFGVPGILNLVEDLIVARDILMAKEAGAKLHLCHCSTRDSVKLTKLAKEEGISVTAEVCPHHFTLTDEDILTKDSNYKMNPPLRSREDVEALKAGLRDGIMDVISTDHAPHSDEEKKRPLEESPFGIVGSETAVGLTITELVEQGYLTPMEMAEKMSYNPARILGIDRGTLEVGKTADITVINPNEEYVINVEEFASKGRNTPLNGRRVRGRVKATICSGKLVYQDK